MNYGFHPHAPADFLEAALRYEEKRESLGHQFEVPVDDAVKITPRSVLTEP